MASRNSKRLNVTTHVLLYTMYLSLTHQNHKMYSTSLSLLFEGRELKWKLTTGITVYPSCSDDCIVSGDI